MVVGNCQAGWQLMMAAALEPDVFGPILIAGAPLSYWAGEHGKAPMRYTGGMAGGSWITALTSDIGDGLFDGAWLVQNFERLNPANTYWKSSITFTTISILKRAVTSILSAGGVVTSYWAVKRFSISLITCLSAIDSLPPNW
ncbi:hypothetical protein HORIV_39100 [Vreelandella olivaria]|uniref:Gingipain domain-containing protein n=1 Tax=Vreelandella olivaria TaxID=390919 RepID=A0ABN5WX18_9GAMM|nr:hypothetical protein HORIV_39100 [Halomonas olivaria]